MKLAPYIACICEGSAESAIIDVLVDNNLLIFTREDMMIYRVLEKLKINHMFGLNAISYGVTAVLTLTGAIAFSYIAKVVLEKFIMCMKERVNHV